MSLKFEKTEAAEGGWEPTRTGWVLTLPPGLSRLEERWYHNLYEVQGPAGYLAKKLAGFSILTPEEIVGTMMAMLKEGFTLDEMLTCPDEEIRQAAKTFQAALEKVRAGESPRS